MVVNKRVNNRRGPGEPRRHSNRVSRGKADEPMTGDSPQLCCRLSRIPGRSGWLQRSLARREPQGPFAEVEALGAGALAMLDMPAAHYRGFYEGFANSALWPALHSRADLIRRVPDDYICYRE